MEMAIIVTQKLAKIYGEGDAAVSALDGIDMEVQKGEFVAIVGQSGSGKSTLLHMLGGLDVPSSGRISVSGVMLSELNDEDLTTFRRQNVGFVFQNYNLLPLLNVYENIVLPIHLDEKKVDESFVDLLIELLGLNDKRNSFPNTLSGGQQQRVAIARALATKPAIILADEPTGNLDTKNSMDVLDILKETSNKFNQTVIMITHNSQLAEYADRIICIEDGHISKDGI